MKNGFFGIVGLVIVSSCIGCKSGNGIDILMDVNPLNRPMGQIRIQPVPEDERRIAKTSGIEVHFNLKRDGGTIGHEDINIDVRLPGETSGQPVVRQADSGKKAQEPPVLLPVPDLPTVRR